MSKRNGNTGLKALAAIMAVLFVLLAVAGVVAYFSDWFTNWDKFKIEQEEPTEETANGGMLIGESEGAGVSLLSEKIAKADYAAYGVSPRAFSAFTLTATVTPANAANKAVDWSVAFVNPSSSWATGKTVTDYVTVTPTSDGALTATVECAQPFGEQIKVIVTHRENANATASCTADFMKILTGIRVYLSDSSETYYDFTISQFSETELDTFQFQSKSDVSTGPQYEFLYTDYTVDNTYTFRMDLTPCAATINKLKELNPSDSVIQNLSTDKVTYTWDAANKRFGTDTVRSFKPNLRTIAFLNFYEGNITEFTSATFGGNDKYDNDLLSVFEQGDEYYYYDIVIWATASGGDSRDNILAIRYVSNTSLMDYKVRSLNLNNSSIVF